MRGLQEGEPLRDLGAVLFDLDGTLVHTPLDFPRMKRAVLAEVARCGLDPVLLEQHDVLAIIREAAAALPEPDGFRRRAEALLVEIEVAACEGAVEADGAAETLEWLRARGLRVGIVTRNCPQAVGRVLGRIPLSHEVLLTRADTPRVKPDPLHLLLALERLRVPSSRALMVGDHAMDILAGKAAGMRTAGVLLPERSPDYFHDVAPDRIIRTLPELRPWISPS